MNINTLEIPTPKTIFQLVKILMDIVTMKLTNQNKPYALSLAATATLYYMGYKLNCDGDIMDKADTDILRRTRNLYGPYAIISLEDQLKYDLHSSVYSWVHEPCNRFWLSNHAKELLTKYPSLDNQFKERCSYYVIQEIKPEFEALH